MWCDGLCKLLISLTGIDPEDARGVEEKVMLEDAQDWLNKRVVSEITDRSGMAAPSHHCHTIC